MQLYAGRSHNAASKNRALFWAASALANNAPDIDLLYSGITQSPLGYLLHHRGHTHTVPGLALLGSLLALGFALASARGHIKWIATLLAVGLGLHVAMDFLNSYGVHPFWPWNNAWYYGDTLFIVEPWLWASLVPALIWASPRRWLRYLLIATLVACIGLCVSTGYVPWQMTLLIALHAAWLMGLMFKTGEKVRLAACALSAIAVVSIFAAVSAASKKNIAEILSRRFPNTTVRDVALGAYPANPLCWIVNTVEVDNGVYTARKGVYAAFPKFYGAGECPNLFSSSGSAAELEPVAAPPRPELVWSGQFRANLASLAALKADYCPVREFLRFARVPFWRQIAHDAYVVGDLRFDRGNAPNFASMRVGASGQGRECPKHVPPWDPSF